MLTGSVGSKRSDQRPIFNGKVEGDRVTFEIESPNGTVMRFDLTASEDSVEGDVRAATPGGENGGRLALKRTSRK